MASSKKALVSLALMGALAFSGCGSNSTPDFSGSSSSASASETQSVDQVASFLEDYFAGLKDNSTKSDSLPDDVKDTMSNVEADNVESMADFSQAIEDKLSDDEKTKILDYFKSNDSTYNYFDHSNMTDGESIVLSVLNFTMYDSVEMENIGIDSSKIDMGDNSAELSTGIVTDASDSSASASASASSSSEDVRAYLNLLLDGQVLHNTDGNWKIDGKTYLENFDELLSLAG